MMGLLRSPQAVTEEPKLNQRRVFRKNDLHVTFAIQVPLCDRCNPTAHVEFCLAILRGHWRSGRDRPRFVELSCLAGSGAESVSGQFPIASLNNFRELAAAPARRHFRRPRRPRVFPANYYRTVGWSALAVRETSLLESALFCRPMQRSWCPVRTY